jgi:Universal stress protein family
MFFLKIHVAVDDSEGSEKVYDMSAQLAKLTNGKLIMVHVVVHLYHSVEVCFTLCFWHGYKIRIDLEEAGRRILQNYSEKSTNEYKIASETILAQGYPPDAIIREADAKMLT